MNPLPAPPAWPGRWRLPGAGVASKLIRARALQAIQAGAVLPAVALALLLAAVFVQQPRALSYFGIDLLLNLAIPVMFATLAQLMFLAVSDLDLSIGPFVSLVACIGATLLPQQPALGLLALAMAVGVYALAGALIEARQLPSIVVTLGLSFVWLGSAVLLLPTPGGSAPEWLRAAMLWRTPWLPMPIWMALAAALAGHLLITRSAFGTLVRGLGGNPGAIARAGWRLARMRAGVYAIAGLFGVCAGLTLVGQATSADANIAARYTLVSIAAAILGGAQLAGGKVAPVGAVIGALTVTLAASFLTFLNVAPDWQLGMQGLILVAVLALRAVIDVAGGQR
ncbi:ABC transporter permease [Verminephrobacter eiseniae]|uniref:ABC transporter permease n=1 Tax=Verminephrobacter eiseniae TaxID=364317 RepID=UPI0022371B6F|nr:ABC transporter permease [Verminephrobacter eiseniae]